MATRPVCLLFCCCYLLLASEVSGIAPVIYPAKISSQCGEDNPLKDGQITEALRQIRQQVGPPYKFNTSTVGIKLLTEIYSHLLGTHLSLVCIHYKELCTQY